MKTKVESKFEEIEKINKRIAILQTERDSVISKAMKEGEFEDDSHLSSAYIEWQQTQKVS